MFKEILKELLIHSNVFLRSSTIFVATTCKREEFFPLCVVYEHEADRSNNLYPQWMHSNLIRIFKNENSARKILFHSMFHSSRAEREQAKASLSCRHTTEPGWIASKLKKRQLGGM